MSRASNRDLIEGAGSGPHSPPFPAAPCGCRHDGRRWLAFCPGAKAHWWQAHLEALQAHRAAQAGRTAKTATPVAQNADRPV